MRDQEQAPISRPEPELQIPGDRKTSDGRSARRSLEDPEAYQDFVDSLFAKIRPRMCVKLDDEAQIEIAGLTRLLTTLPREAVEKIGSISRRLSIWLPKTNPTFFWSEV